MRTGTARLTATALAVCIAGCAVSPRQFAAQRTTLSDVDVCRAYEASRKSRDVSFIMDTERELNARGVVRTNCPGLISAANQKTGQAVVGIAAALLLIAAVAAGGGGGGAGQSYANTTDYAWSWDLHYNQYGQLVWSCRGEQTGQFADLYRCQGKIKSDYKWTGY